MSYLFDSSSIFKAIKSNTIEVLTGNYTLEIARYELGNILWKERSIFRRIDDDELEGLVRLVKKTLNLLKVLNIECHEEEIAKLAKDLKITFYDASYTFHSKEMNLKLITEDKELKAKIKNQVKTLSLNEIVKL